MKKTDFYPLYLLLSTVLILPAAAQTDLAAVLDTQYEEDLLFSDIPSVFSASKYQQKITEAPARVSIVTAQDIQRFGHRTLVDVVNTLPGFQTSNDSTFSYIGTRGFGVPGDFNSRILILVDGHRMNENIYDGVVVDQGFIVDLDLVERIEFVRGSASSLYGSSAFFGVINVITKRGRYFQGAELSTSTGSQDSHQTGINIGQRYNNGVEILLSASAYSSDGEHSIYYAAFDDAANNNGIAENVDQTKSRRMYAKASYQDFSLIGAYQKQQKTLPTASYGTVFNDPRTISWEQRAYLDLTYQHLFSSGLDLSARLFYDKYRYDGDWVYDYAELDQPADLIVLKDQAIGNWWGSEMLATGQYGHDHRITLGAEYRNSLNEEQHTYDIYDVYLDVETDSSTWAVYLQDNFQLRENLTFNIGLRFDDFSDFGHTSNPRLAAIYNATETSTVKFVYGTAFRAPNKYELHYADLNTQKIPDNLKPEEIKTFELILEQVMTANSQLVLSFYRNEIDHLITVITDPSDDLLVFKNQEKATVEGVELEVLGQWPKGWNSLISYTFQDSEYKSGETVPNTSRNMVKFSVSTPTWSNGLSAALEMHYEDGRPRIQDGKTNANSVSNLSLTHNDLVDGLVVSAGVYNLFDEHYAIPAGEEHAQLELRQEERTFRIKFSYTY